MLHTGFRTLEYSAGFRIMELFARFRPSTAVPGEVCGIGLARRTGDAASEAGRELVRPATVTNLECDGALVIAAAGGWLPCGAYDDEIVFNKVCEQF